MPPTISNHPSDIFELFACKNYNQNAAKLLTIWSVIWRPFRVIAYSSPPVYGVLRHFGYSTSRKVIGQRLHSRRSPRLVHATATMAPRGSSAVNGRVAYQQLRDPGSPGCRHETGQARQGSRRGERADRVPLALARAMQVISQKDEELRSVAPVRHAPPSRPPRAHRLKSRARQNRAQPSGGIGRGTCTGADRARTAGGARDGALSIAHDPIRVERGHRCEDTHPRRRRRRTPSWRAQHAPHQIRRSPSPSARLSAMKLSGQVFSCVTARTAVHLAGK